MNAVVEVEKIKARIAELEKERDTLVQQANSQLTGYNAAIGEMMKLIAPPQVCELCDAEECTCNDD